jgi:hypothetical protein
VSDHYLTPSFPFNSPPSSLFSLCYCPRLHFPRFALFVPGPGDVAWWVLQVFQSFHDDDLVTGGPGIEKEEGGLLPGRVLLAGGQQLLLVVLLGEVFRVLVLAA